MSLSLDFRRIPVIRFFFGALVLAGVLEASLPEPGQVQVELRSGRRYTLGAGVTEVALVLRSRSEDQLVIDRSRLELKGADLVSLREESSEIRNGGEAVRERHLVLKVRPKEPWLNRIEAKGIRVSTSVDDKDRDLPVDPIEITRVPTGVVTFFVGTLLMSVVLWEARRRRLRREMERENDVRRR